MKVAGHNISWKDSSLQNFISLNISAHMFNKASLVVLDVFLVRQSKADVVPVAATIPVISPVY